MFEVAQINVGRMNAPLDDPAMVDFVAQLETVNSMADRSEGFVWRLKSEQGDATAFRVFDDPLVLINMSVWKSIEALYRFVYQGLHLEIIRKKRSWFGEFGAAYMALWWIREGHIPPVEEGKERLDLLQRFGPTPRAFTFGHRFAPPIDETVGWSART